ncbi:DedA family protein [Sphingomonas sp. BN140010]|uniref:DedA family protein n=1 Tax=Sphingomonas arvum TaxID=2992113 RepID=A0ABT3JHV9_9SPHN|nr:DedA family protein [Sphingomonas sp. BN140010]MCW3798667.1 DedA family protein [Sphingomonas sp. BN140010]
MHHAVSHWVEQYGVLGVFLAAFLEGELGVVVGGAMAHLGRLSGLHVLLAAWSAAVISAQLFFVAGRSQRDARWVHKVTDKRAFALAIRWIDRHPRLFCLGYRFVYGMRVVGPVAISLSHMPARTFLLFNLCTALVWACVGVGLGWWFGPELAHLVRRWFTLQRFAVASAVALMLFVGLIAWRARRAARRRAEALAVAELLD